MQQELSIIIEADSKQELYEIKSKLIEVINGHEYLDQKCKLVFFHSDLQKNAELQELEDNWNMGFIDRQTYMDMKKKFS